MSNSNLSFYLYLWRLIWDWIAYFTKYQIRKETSSKESKAVEEVRVVFRYFLPQPNKVTKIPKKCYLQIRIIVGRPKRWSCENYYTFGMLQYIYTKKYIITPLRISKYPFECYTYSIILFAYVFQKHIHNINATIDSSYAQNLCWNISVESTTANKLLRSISTN